MASSFGLEPSAKYLTLKLNKQIEVAACTNAPTDAIQLRPSECLVEKQYSWSVLPLVVQTPLMMTTLLFIKKLEHSILVTLLSNSSNCISRYLKMITSSTAYLHKKRFKTLKGCCRMLYGKKSETFKNRASL